MSNLGKHCSNKYELYSTYSCSLEADSCTCGKDFGLLYSLLLINYEINNVPNFRKTLTQFLWNSKFCLVII